MTVAAMTLVPAKGIGNQITNYNASPSVRVSKWSAGWTYDPLIAEDWVTVPVNMPITNFLPVLRVPTDAILKKLEIIVDTAPSTSLTLSCGLTFSNGGQGAAVGASPTSGITDGTTAANMSQYSTTAQTSAISQVVSFSFFTLNTSITAIANWVDITYANWLAGGNSVTDGFYVPSASMKPLWQALGAGGNGGLGKATGATSATVGNAFTTCQSDPRGFFDICIASNTVGVNTSALQLGMRATYIGGA